MGDKIVRPIRCEK